eukprot:1979541-Rhodomonas_salina.1
MADHVLCHVPDILFLATLPQCLRPQHPTPPRSLSLPLPLQALRRSDTLFSPALRYVSTGDRIAGS